MPASLLGASKDVLIAPSKLGGAGCEVFRGEMRSYGKLCARAVEISWSRHRSTEHLGPRRTSLLRPCAGRAIPPAATTGCMHSVGVDAAGGGAASGGLNKGFRFP